MKVEQIIDKINGVLDDDLISISVLLPHCFICLVCMILMFFYDSLFYKKPRASAKWFLGDCTG